MRIYIGIIFLALTYGCNSGETQIIIRETLPFEADLTVSKVVPLDDNSELFRPFRIRNLNDDYVVVSELLPENIFKVFKLPGMNFQYKWGKLGQGPNEFRGIPGDIMTSGDDLIIYDPVLKKLRTFEVKDSSVTHKKDMLLSYKNQLDPLNRIQRMNDTLYFVDYGTSIEKSNTEHVALKPDEEDTLFTFGEYPDSELKEAERYFKFLKTNMSKPDGSLFAAFYLYQNKIKIYNTSGEIVKHIDLIDDHFSSSEETNNIIYREASWSSDDFIYTLGLNSSSEALYENPDSTLKTFIEIFDWNGNQLFRAEFDRLINGFTVSEKYSKIYAYSILEPQKLFVYELPKI
ncbi:MAG TPA: hypothetical protein DCL80_11745 [Balneola sp.]|jgi:hypothetical protein|nr:hypothetical protein [Balneola sp.]MAO77610.1 hypothetical protein [Balneola sp.]MBF64807.1 hypothetical protein [Balneola sp.]HAH51879.1 hypothetical protein [Balneola sp.]HBZ39347.1 hypothetical protein [Balneola sp.]|tara:strand:+ start:2998 stop:4035 length:1038 start_codon:yes stop_codon:yes gene_type:complete